MATAGTKAILAALFANLGIAVAKFVAFLFTGAASMLAEAIHSVADSANQGLLLLGTRKAKRQPTPLHPFGFGRERYFWSFVVALVLFTMGALFSLFEGWEKLRHPHELDRPEVAIGVLTVAIVLEIFSMHTAVVESRPYKGDASWWTFIRRSRIPELPVVLLEDAGALIGLVLALAAVSLSALTDDVVFDALGTLSIGVLLFVIAVVLMVEMKGLLIGEAATEQEQRTIRSALESHANVRQVIHMRTQHLGPEELLVGAKIELEPGLDVAAVARTINETERSLRQAVTAARVIYIEPDLHHGETTAPR